ncbi:MAG TPA: T9SS type A sorting domain-containing protein, partial [Ferruginibacter sp.]|nr:T9SS type A sorting domain-containing protein [Ferruginibacter sp.]
GVNYGWRCYEGAHLYSGGGCSPTDTVSPVFEYGHNGTTGGFSITGGYVYRGTEFPALQGYYITTDYVSTNLWLIRPNGVGGFTSTQQSAVLSNISGFGEGADGTLFAIRRSNGTLYKVIVTSLVPVTLTQFKAKSYNGYNQLNWISATETNTNKYHIEYSIDGIQFIRVGQVAATRNSTGSQYNYRHNILPAQNMYYRLAIEDADGSISYSAIVRLSDDNDKPVKVYPTVTSNGTIQVDLKRHAKNIQLINSNGSLVYQKNMQGLLGIIPINLPALPKGVYVIMIYGNDFSVKEKIILQ